MIKRFFDGEKNFHFSVNINQLKKHTMSEENQGFRHKAGGRC